MCACMSDCEFFNQFIDEGLFGGKLTNGNSLEDAGPVVKNALII